jgi:hypothetical protein
MTLMSLSLYDTVQASTLFSLVAGLLSFRRRPFGPSVVVGQKRQKRQKMKGGKEGQGGIRDSE